MLTPAEPMEKLSAFYRRVRPEGPGWNRVASVTGFAEAHAEGKLATQFFNWFLGCAMIYATLFGIGKLIFKEWLPGLLFLAVAISAGVLISRNLSRVGWKTVGESDLGPSDRTA
jgi:solute:Na+ symporter, SSS family